MLGSQTLNPTTVQKASKVRWFLLSVIFALCLVAYLDRVNLSVCAPMIMEQLGFDKVQLSLTMSAFFLSYAVMQIPGAMLVERYGTRKIGAAAMIWWSVFTILTPLAWGLYSFLAVRLLFGMGEGPLYPNNATFFSKWFNSKEKGISSSLMMTGTFLGPALGPPLSVFIISVTSWHWVFYIYGILGLVGAAIWLLYSRDTPHEHKSVNEAELCIITESEDAQPAPPAPRQAAPWKQFLAQPRFWCFGIQYFCTNYIMYVFLSWLPMYLLEARGMSFTAMGGAAALPWVSIGIVMVLCGLLSDRLILRGSSKFIARALLGMIGMGLCGLFLFLAASAASVFENVLWLSLSLGALGTNYTASWAGCQDLGRQFGGSVSAWMNTWGTLGGITAPIATALLVEAIGWDNALNCTAVLIFLGIACWIFVKPDQPLAGDSLPQTA